MAEFEFPGVFVEEAGGRPKPIDSVPTGAADPLAGPDRARWLYGIAIGGAALAGLGLWLAMSGFNVVVELVDSPAGLAGLGAVFVSALVLGMSRTLVEWRRRRAGCPPLTLGKVAFGPGVFVLAKLVAVAICLLAIALSLLVARAFTPILFAAAINVLVGCTFVGLAATALRDLLLLLQAAREGR